MSGPFDMKIVFSRHARESMAARRVTFAEVKDVIRNYEIGEPHDGARRYVKGDLVAVVREWPNAKMVLTVLWRRPEQWTSEEMVEQRASQKPRS